MNYFGEGYYRADLLIHANEAISRETLDEKVNKLKALFSLKQWEKAMVLIDKNWIGIDCDSLHQQVHESTVRKCAEIWQMPVILYDIFDEDVIILGYGDSSKGVYEIGHSDDCLDEDLTDFPAGLLPFFSGREEEIQELWEEQFVFASEKLVEFSKYMSVPIPDYMLGVHDVEEIPEHVQMLMI